MSKIDSERKKNYNNISLKDSNTLLTKVIKFPNAPHPSVTDYNKRIQHYKPYKYKSKNPKVIKINLSGISKN
jgi:hypothetical protein